MAAKSRKTGSSSPSIAGRLIADLMNFRKQKVVDLRAVRNARIRAEELDAVIASEEELSRLDPVHAVYVYALNKMDIFISQLASVPAVKKLVAIGVDAEREYMPEGPPMSPLTLSYFTCWSFFDLCIGAKKESFGTITIEVFKALKADPGLIGLFEKMQASRMGFYVHEGFSGRHVRLRELVTERSITATVPSGHKGQPGEIWLARIMPDPFEELPFGYSVVFTTPYVIWRLEGSLLYPVGDRKGWLAFFDRTLGKTGKSDRIAAYEHLMKYGLNRHYWNEYIFEAYVNHVLEAIFLTGFPDLPLTRPHSRESTDLRG
jgi:hypothetical protein